MLKRSDVAEPFYNHPIQGLPSDSRNPFVDDERRLIDRLIEEQLIEISYQPIVDLHSRAIFAYEALARPRDGYFRTPDELIDSAVRGNCMGKLGRYLRQLSIRGCQRWPLFLNLDPHEFGDAYLVQPDEPALVNERPVYLEISEAVPTEFFAHCAGALAELRDKGVLLAIDDFGAGSSSLKSIVELRPDIVKLDRELIMGCLPQSREFDLLKSLTDLCHRMDSTVIAEGIETVDELKACIAAGIDFGQGFLLSVPHNPPPSFFWPPELPPDSTAFLRPFKTSRDIDSDSESEPKKPLGSTVTTAAEAEIANSRITIRRLEDELAETRNELTEVLIERSALAEKVKRLSLATGPQPKRERKRAPAAPALSAPSPPPSTPAFEPANSKEEDALDFLRQIEEERAGKAADGGS